MTMIERVARALCAVEMADPDAITIHQQPQWKVWEEHARAAIEAMREPSADMVEVGAPAVRDLDVDFSPHSAPREGVTEAWRAMIDAALTNHRK